MDYYRGGQVRHNAAAPQRILEVRTMFAISQFELNSLALMGPALTIVTIGALLVFGALVAEGWTKKREAKQWAFWKYGQESVITKRYTALEMKILLSDVPKRSVPPEKGPLEDSIPTIPRLRIPGDIW